MVWEQSRHTISAVFKVFLSTCTSTLMDHLSLDHFLASHLWKFWLHSWLQCEAFMRHVESLCSICLKAKTQHSGTSFNRSINKGILGKLSFLWLHQPVSSFACEAWILGFPQLFSHVVSFLSFAEFSALSVRSPVPSTGQGTNEPPVYKTELDLLFHSNS